MKTIIAGSRTVTDPSLVLAAIMDSGFKITEVVCGCAEGPDRLGFEWARENNVPVHFFPAWPFQHEWAMQNVRDGEFVEPHFGAAGKAAGFARNGQMAFYASKGGALILVWNGESRGSADMLRRANNLRVKVFVATTGHQRILQ